MEEKSLTKFILVGVFAIAVVALGFWVVNYEKPEPELTQETAGPDISGVSIIDESDDIWWDEEYSINIENSELRWTGYKLAGSHTGTVGIKEGIILEKDGIFAGGWFKIGMNSILVDDIEDEESNKSLVDHLKNEEFFNTAEFPEATFTIDQVLKEKGVNMYSTIGKFTIKGVEREIGLFTHIVKEGDRYIIKSDFAIDRTLWGIRYGSNKFFDDLGDKLIDDTIEFELKMVLDKEDVQVNEEVVE
ncbi:MAG: YceI family protein [Candidatus Magasanikbacteria bacterium]|nr:YceI family protein [Candidatus Magasanikbacteria bacterium]